MVTGAMAETIFVLKKGNNHDEVDVITIRKCLKLSVEQKYQDLTLLKQLLPNPGTFHVSS